jgi:tRNA(Ile2) C34 agmatinyltransferase TiaS
MKKTRGQMEKELEGKTKEAIKKLLDWNEVHAAPDLTQIEEIVLELREELGKEFAASLVSSQEKVEPVVERCGTCGQEMRNKGRKRKVVESRVGEIDLERGYYYCPECGAGIFPPGSTVEGRGETAE